MPRVILPIADGFYISQSTPFMDKRLINMYPTIPQADAASQRAVFNTPGIGEFSDTGDSGACRGSIKFNDGVPYFIIGTSLYSIDSAGVATDRGVISGSSNVSLSTNGINIAIQDPDGDSYFYTPSTATLEDNAGAAFLSFGQTKTVTFKDGYYVYNTDSELFSGSIKTTNDGKDFDALDFSDAEIDPDKIIKLINNHNQLYVLGESTIEIFATVGGTAFPFERISGGIVQVGCTAPNSVVNFSAGFTCIGADKGEMPSVWHILGSQKRRISNASIDQILHQYSDEEISEATAFPYAQNGQFFVVFTIKDHTLVYDAVTSNLTGIPQWHERQTGILGGNGFASWRALFGIDAYGRILVGDDRTGKIGELDLDCKFEYGSKIERNIMSKPFVTTGENVFSHEVELFMETGVGNDDVIDPKIRMDYSDDGGRTFSNEVAKPLGKKGEYKTRVRWKRLGRIPNSRIVRFRVTDPCSVNIYSLFANAEATNSG